MHVKPRGETEHNCTFKSITFLLITLMTDMSIMLELCICIEQQFKLLAVQTVVKSSFLPRTQFKQWLEILGSLNLSLK